MKTSSRYIFAFFIIILFSPTAFTQTQWIDSLKKAATTQKADISKVGTLNTLSDTYRFSYPDTALLYAQQALSLAEKLHSDSAIFWSIVTVNGVLYVLGNYTMELDYAFKALPLAKKLNTPYTLGFSNGMISDCYYNLGEYNTSLKYWREVVKIAEEKLPNERSSIYANSSNIFLGMKEYDSALIYAEKSYELMKQSPSFNTPWDKSNIYTFLGNAFAGKGYYDSALFYYRASLPFSDDIKMGLNKVNAYIGIAKIFQEKGSLDSSTWYAKRVLGEKIIKTYSIGLLKAANLLAAVYESQKNADSSLKYLHIAIDVRDSLFNREKTIAFQNIIFKEKDEQKAVEAATLKLRNEYRMYFLIALFSLLVIISGVVIRNRRIKQLQNMRNSIADDLHDDIGSALSSISIMSELAKTKSPDSWRLLNSIGESTAAVQENMSDIVWTVNPKNDRFENVLQRMNLFASEILEARNIGLEFINDSTVTESHLSMKQRKDLYLFFKEAINNAAKYSGAEKVRVCISKKDYWIDMNIADNGKGFDTSGVSNGNGINSLKKRAADLNAYFNITSHLNKGTSVQLRFKIT